MTTANSQTTKLIEEFEEIRSRVPSIQQHRNHIRHVKLKGGIDAEVRLEVVTIEALFIKKKPQ